MTIAETNSKVKKYHRPCLAFLTATLLVGLSATHLSAQDGSSAEQSATAETTTGTLAVPPAAPVEPDSQSPLTGFVLLAIVIALFVVPMFLGGYLAKRLRMPDYGWKFSLAIGSLLAAAVVIYEGEIKYGPDLSGGITLIYELQDTAGVTEDGEDSQDGQSSSSRSQLVRQLIAALGERVDPSGTKEVSIREYGPDQIEIIIPKASPAELDYIERKVYTAGALEFRITASPVFAENKKIIELAEALPPGENEVRMGGRKVAEWMLYDEDKLGPFDQADERFVKRMAGKLPQALVLMNDGFDVTGEYLEKAAAGFDETGQPEVRFNFDEQGAFRFGRLSGQHIPNPSGQKYYLGIILDGNLLSAPAIQSKITSSGRITGIKNKDEVDFVVDILNSGSLPASLNKDPISREIISPTIGVETVRMGRTAILASLIIVMLFMLLYYRFAGFVACLALGANLLLILGVMVLLHAAFTLPGLAGLVLTVGMSVDANVLIYERIREERSRGAALRMAIRNGYAKAMSTIVDANLTNLITAVAIYKIAPDNVKGFGVTLIIGIIMSMYSAVFLSRLIFDIAERTNRLKELSMAQFIGKTDFDFMGKRGIAIVLSLVLIAFGLYSVVNRGNDLLNIDFTGGSSVTVVLRDDAKMPFADVKKLLEKTDLSDKNLSLVEIGTTNTRYSISSVEQDVEAVLGILKETFGERLQTHQVTTSNIKSLGDNAKSSLDPSRSKVMQVNFQNDDSDDNQAARSTASDESKEEESATNDLGTSVSRGLFDNGTSAEITFGREGDEDAGVNQETASQLIQDALAATGHSSVAFAVENPDYQPGSARRFTNWIVKLALPVAEAKSVFSELEKVTNSQPVFPLANKIGGRVAGDLRTKAFAAIFVSLVGIIAYIWFRFQKIYYGVAAVIAVVHDVLVAIGMIALSATIVSLVPGLAEILMIEKFQISLTIVAALLTIIGYSLNDTIVIFDRIREVKGKSPYLTRDMINLSINQTLSRTILTSLTTLLSVILLYILGGDGIHGFAFSLLVGIVAGTYSTVFIAAPILLWMSPNEAESSAKAGTRVPKETLAAASSS
ncbi:protein translocase subunit SecD [Bythopirellula polymerisocia]|uniref:Multifunctional fusion protein n=1 Tax=Bythopirellula polymerisocia TaxID=2528003 RepID=A0A5C6CHV3_9BACT|nr:protein translocase subunit SecD [Bythopirellula polymerisocia]TWU23812.1 bifunctional preprotein translocase subunit SecD/SecF [Bythopirellula polymerisocia]